MRRYFWRILPGEAGLGAADGDLAGRGAGAAERKRGRALFCLTDRRRGGCRAYRTAARRDRFCDTTRWRRLAIGVGGVSFRVVWVWSRHSGEKRSPSQGVDSGFRRNDGIN